MIDFGLAQSVLLFGSLFGSLAMSHVPSIVLAISMIMIAVHELHRAAFSVVD